MIYEGSFVMKGYKWFLIIIGIPLAILIFGFCRFVHIVRRFDANVRQKAQLHSIDAATELFKNEFENYPPSDANDPNGLPYCGAMKLAEALIGRDLLGFHTQSVFRQDGLDAAGDVVLYRNIQDGLDFSSLQPDLPDKEGPYLPKEYANISRLAEIYGKGRTSPFPEDYLVLCDTFKKKRPSGKKTGMPILYYRADPNRTVHDVNNPDNPENIYNYKDNQALIALGIPRKPKAVHPLLDSKRFYKMTQDHKSDSASIPYRPDTYLLISAGSDGRYGTDDDIVNFNWKYRPWDCSCPLKWNRLNWKQCCFRTLQKTDVWAIVSSGRLDFL